jgi:glycosyltransferase involved in cell wall biosynthesis
MPVSVCMSTYNGSRYLREQVESILLQLGPMDELVVVDDGSRDDSVAMLQALGDMRIRIHCNERNWGPIRSFERALGLAKGEIVFLADQDDVWLPGKVQAMSAALDGAELVVSDCRVVDQALCELHPSFFARQRSGPGLLRNLARNSFLGCCMALRRELLQFALPFPARVPMHDWWLGLVGQAFGRVVFLPQPLLLYRRHGANASTAAQASTASWSTRIRWRLRLVSALAARKARAPGGPLAADAARSGGSP